MEPAPFDDVLAESRVIFVTASVTTENTHLFDRDALSQMQDGAMLVLLSRAALADFDALAAEAASGRLRIATDVFPDEPVSADDPIRSVPNVLFSAHRAGALTSALRDIGAYVLEDLSLIARGLPPRNVSACGTGNRDADAVNASFDVLELARLAGGYLADGSALFTSEASNQFVLFTNVPDTFGWNAARSWSIGFT